MRAMTTVSHKRERGRPREYGDQAPVSLLLPADKKAEMQALARSEGLSLAAWIRQQVLRVINSAAA